MTIDFRSTTCLVAIDSIVDFYLTFNMRYFLEYHVFLREIDVSYFHVDQNTHTFNELLKYKEIDPLQLNTLHLNNMLRLLIKKT